MDVDIYCTYILLENLHFRFETTSCVAETTFWKMFKAVLSICVIMCLCLSVRKVLLCFCYPDYFM